MSDWHLYGIRSYRNYHPDDYDNPFDAMLDAIEFDGRVELGEIVALLPDGNGNDYYGNHYPVPGGAYHFRPLP